MKKAGGRRMNNNKSVVTSRNIYKKTHYCTHIKLGLPLHRKRSQDIQCKTKKKTNKQKQEKFTTLYFVWNHDYKQSLLCLL